LLTDTAFSNRVHRSTGAFCLYKDVTTKHIPLPVNQDVGDVMDPNKRCKLEQKSEQAYAADDGTADEYCRNVVCRVPKEGTTYHRISKANPRPPGENTPCGKGGVSKPKLIDLARVHKI